MGRAGGGPGGLRISRFGNKSFYSKACHKGIGNGTAEGEPFTHGEEGSSRSFLPIIQTLSFLLRGRKLDSIIFMHLQCAHFWYPRIWV